MTFSVGDRVGLLREPHEPVDADDPLFVLFDGEEEAHEEFNQKNGYVWEIIGRSSGWWSDVQPWRLKSVLSGQEIDRFDEQLKAI